MTLTNTKTGKSIENLSQKEAARIIGVNQVTVWRWKTKKKKNNEPLTEFFNHWILDMKPIRYKQPKRHHKNNVISNR